MSLTKNKIILILGFLIATLFLSYQSIYTVAEGHTALLEKANLANSQVGPGLHFALPFFVRPEQIDLRLRSISFTKSNLLTADGHPLLIDYYTKWKIIDPVLYYQQTHNDSQKTQQRLTQIINTLLQTECARNTLNTIISNPNVSTQTVRAQANQQLQTLGISLVDIGFKSIDFPTEANNTLLENRRLEQAQIALEQRAMGKANAESIRLKADNDAALELAKATEEAAFIRGQGDAEAAKIYSAAYQKNPQFAAFYLNLEAYRKGFTQSSTKNNFLVLNIKDGLFNAKENLRLKS
ncbi:protease modulator HflC [Rickettsiella endosymbiont of Dermanyssus gallinae]|uniref:protease modulator HflC n=1 Tax=Rickettsiella endosymbiont of Dermanyssus gallinae TaxID=2856608 RepID=UPI001C5338D9|nr:protease modulator HflC [Rickettsiella endosymbiont of Dermanyssus gallinae]